LNFREKERGRSFLFSRAYRTFVCADSKEIEDAPVAAYKYRHDKLAGYLF
jgi:hypothetical protein